MLELPAMAYQPKAPTTLPSLRLRNQRTQALIRRDVIWQIALPLGLAIVIVLVLMGLLIAPVGAPVRSVWADISLIFLIVPAALLGLIFLAITSGLIWLAAKGLTELPFLLKRAQDFVALAAYRVDGAASSVSNVFLSIRSIWAGARKAAADARAIIPVRRRS